MVYLLKMVIFHGYDYLQMVFKSYSYDAFFFQPTKMIYDLVLRKNPHQDPFKLLAHRWRVRAPQQRRISTQCRCLTSHFPWFFWRFSSWIFPVVNPPEIGNLLGSSCFFWLPYLNCWTKSKNRSTQADWNPLTSPFFIIFPGKIQTSSISLARNRSISILWGPAAPWHTAARIWSWCCPCIARPGAGDDWCNRCGWRGFTVGTVASPNTIGFNMFQC